MAYLVLVRHGQSEWNALGKWTGQQDVALTEQGKADAREAAKALEGLEFHKGYTSNLKRTHQTLDEIKRHLDIAGLETEAHDALAERHYGDYTGMDKWEAKERMSEEEFNNIRRGWNHPIPNGENLKQVHARVVPYYEAKILADLKAGKNVIVAAHGNSLRALMKHLENVPDDEAHTLEIGTAGVLMYTINDDGSVAKKATLHSGHKA